MVGFSPRQAAQRFSPSAQQGCVENENPQHTAQGPKRSFINEPFIILTQIGMTSTSAHFQSLWIDVGPQQPGVLPLGQQIRPR